MSATVASPSPSRPPLAALCAVCCGLTVTESVSNYLLPLTLQRFTLNAAVIGLVLALNPLFGFIANPLSGMIGDRLWTRWGRRSVLLVTAAPIVGLSLWFVPGAATLLHIILLVTIYQFFQDVMWGANNPLLAELVPPHLRTLASSVFIMGAQATGWVFSRYGMRLELTAGGEELVYRTSAFAQFLLIVVAASMLRETPPPAHTRPRLTVQRYCRDFFGDPVLRRFGWLGFWQYFGMNVLIGYYVLFAVQTLGLSNTVFGTIWSWHTLTAFFLALPCGYMAERWMPKQQALTIGYTLSMTACAVGWLAEGPGLLLLSVVIFAFGLVIGQVTQKAFLSEFLPPDLIGQLSGTYNVCVALGRTVALAGGGWVISLTGNNYRLIFPMSLLSSLLCIYLACRLHDPRFEERKTLSRRTEPVAQ